MKRGARAVVLVAAFLATQLFACAAVSRAVFHRIEARYIVEVKDTVPPGLPVLVLSQGGPSREASARVVFHRDLPAFVAAHPDYSFLVPAGQEERLRQEVQEHSPFAETQPTQYWFATFKVHAVGQGVQQLEVEGTADDDWVNTAWYEAREKSIAVRRYRTYFGPGVAMANMHLLGLLPVVLNVALWLGARSLWRRRRSARGGSGA